MKLWWLLLIMVPFSHNLTTTYSHHNKILLCTAGHIIKYMAGRALDSLRALDLSIFLLKGYQIFFSRGKDVRTWSCPLSTPTSTPEAEVKPSWHVDKASLHIDIQLLFQTLNLEIGPQPSHKLVCTSQQNDHTHAHARTPTHTHTHTPTEAEVYANSDLAKIQRWAEENKMQYNETKSKAMLITRKRSNTNININIYLNNRRLEVIKEMKYLGIYFDSRLTFDSHIKYIGENSTKLIHMLGRSVKLHWGLGHKALKTI